VSEAHYERYKDALRRGHVAALRGRLDDALAAYREAARTAPERALPHSSRGAVLQRLGQHQEALEAYAAALERQPRDEAALAGRAEVLVVLGRRIEAAETLDRLAEALQLAGRLPEACDTARRALELAESRTRRELVMALTHRLQASPPDDLAVAALERALLVLEPPTMPPAPPAVDERSSVPVEIAPPAVETDRGIELTAEAEALVMAGDAPAARTQCLAAAAAHRAAGRADAAIDACYLGLSIAPDDAALHLTLAELYVERGWRGPAAEKLLLLGRLVELDEDHGSRQRLCALIGARFTDDPRLLALCG